VECLVELRKVEEHQAVVWRLSAFTTVHSVVDAPRNGRENSVTGQVSNQCVPCTSHL